MSLLKVSGHSSGSPLVKLHLENTHIFPHHPKHHPRGESVPLVPNTKCMGDSPSQKHPWEWEEFMSARLEPTDSSQEGPELITEHLRPQLHFSQGLEGAERLAVVLVHSSATKAAMHTNAWRQHISPLNSPNLPAAQWLHHQGVPRSTSLK